MNWSFISLLNFNTTLSTCLCGPGSYYIAHHPAELASQVSNAKQMNYIEDEEHSEETH